jgi:hypothetical protein
MADAAAVVDNTGGGAAIPRFAAIPCGQSRAPRHLRSAIGRARVLRGEGGGMGRATSDTGPRALAERLLDEHDGDAAHALALDRLRDAEARNDRGDARFWRAVVASIAAITGREDRRGPLLRDGSGEGKHDGEAS